MRRYMTKCVDGNDTDEVRRTRAWAASATQVLDSALCCLSFRLGFAPSLGKAVAETRFGAIRDVRRLLHESFSCMLHYFGANGTAVGVFLFPISLHT